VKTDTGTSAERCPSTFRFSTAAIEQQGKRKKESPVCFSYRVKPPPPPPPALRSRKDKKKIHAEWTTRIFRAVIFDSKIF
jgi:hypothetical protein